MGAKYSSVSISGYNATPPSDDGSATEANKVKWSTVKTKLGDPTKTAVESINTALVTALNTSARSITASDTAVAGDHLKTIEIASSVTAAVTVTLSDAATMAAGYIVTVSNQSAVVCTIARATGGDTINGTAANISIAPLASIAFVVNAAASGYDVYSKSGPFVDGDPVVVGGTDGTKKLRFEVDGFTAGQTRVVTFPDANLTVPSLIGITIGTPQATTSGTAYSFTGLPTGLRRVTLSISGVSFDASSALLVQIGDATGGMKSSGYSGGAASDTGAVRTGSTAGFLLTAAGNSAEVYTGKIVLDLVNSSTNTWVSAAKSWDTAAPYGAGDGAGFVALSGALDRIQLTTVGGTAVGDAGAVNISYEA